ncbi:FAD-dependent monooxygenase [Ureibacillus sinduriensis]|uniref:FAD-binding domain-containing protein n=1 Tax=Ureibacillus sinduriensis BLB-1 = JCM 15800 TaxID=1384057 RepID=A0A0A3HX39_9BACL|nr:FAD-dependent monooxygenase [Ureibacillus sinduriensis]KGR77186.1 hypothetical protein CD33_03485 [Ureibacillus sinduriensis BLB-1 = JCM 15800]
MNKSVLIIGAGISGLACALMLEKIGYTPVIYEKSNCLRNGGGGLTLWSNATDAIQSMGLLEEIYQNSKIISESTIQTSSGKTLAKMPLNDLATQYGTHTVGILRANLHHLLSSKLKQTEIKFGYELVDLEKTNKEVIARFANGHVDTGEFLVGADGSNSAVRKKIFPINTLRFSGYEAWRGISTYTNHNTKCGKAFEAWGNGRRFGVIPVSDSLVYWFATRNTTENRDEGEVSKEQLIDIFREFAEPVPSIIKFTEEKDITRKVIYDLKPLQNWSKGRVMLIGDAAHATTPNLGQGACMALEDAVILAQTLAENKSVSQSFKIFEETRMDRVKFIVNRSWLLGRFVQIESKLFCEVRNILVRLSPSIQRNSSFERIIGHKI